MSYILGALKKAEKDRKRDDSLDLDNWDHEDWSRPRENSSNNNIVLYAVLSTLMLVLILFAWLAYEVLIKPQQDVTLSTQNTRIIKATPPARMEVIDASSEDVVPVYVEPESTEVPLQSIEPAKSVKPKTITSPVTQEETLASGKQSNLQVKRTVASQQRPALPKFSGHIYFPNNNRLSRVFSGPNSYKEGDEVEGYLIERIGEGIAVLSFAGKEYRVRLDN